MEKIDVLLATYNGEEYLIELLESILNQTYKNIRLVICDDSSTDETTTILEKYQKKDNRIVLYKNKKNVGSDKTFEYLLTKVESDYFMFADQDDVWNEDKIELTYTKLMEEKADLVFTDLEVVDEKLNTISNSFNKLKKYERKIKKCIENGYDLEILYNTITGCTILSKKNWIKEVIPMPENSNILHDYWVGLVISLKGKIAYLNKTTIKYRQHINNQVGTSRYIDKLNNFDTIRKHLISLKIENFTTFIKNDKLFSEGQNKLNRKALKYYLMIKDKRYINFRGLTIFNKLYKNESVFFYIAFLLIMNFPILVRPLYNLKFIFKK